MRLTPFAILLSTTLSFLLHSCLQVEFEEPIISLEGYQIEEGFHLEVIASEPLLEAPVAMDFDDQGRMWVVQMPGYMETLAGDTEKAPTGSIVVLEDQDRDGIADHSKVFLDSLVLPRALAHVYGGLLYAEPPNLWFVEIENDRPGKRTLVDSLYATEGNVEHQANGLMMNVDNWIYNARSHFRYRRIKGRWIKEATSFRGQWGISRDDFGRLYYNDNSTQLVGDYVLPNHHIHNPYWQSRGGIGKVLTDNQRVYPIQATLVNRGYQPGVLDADSMLINATSACGPMVYRGGAFPTGYDQNAFVCIPEVNAIKRNVLHFQGPYTRGLQALAGEEFLASTDEAFRPVNLHNGPDGAIYVVDLHRGILQHGAYMTSYLRDKLEERGFDKFTGMGRILKITAPEVGDQKIPVFHELSVENLISLLGHENGWIRDRSQQLLIRSKGPGLTDQVGSYLLSTDNDIARIHALFVLEGLGALNHDLLIQALPRSGPEFIAHALRLLDPNMIVESQDVLQELITRNDPVIDLYLIPFLASNARPENSEWLMKMVNQYDTLLYHDAFLSTMAQEVEELDFQQIKSQKLRGKYEEMTQNRSNNTKHWIHQRAVLPSDNRTVGLKLFREICTACHGNLGQGIEGLAPPLVNSEYIKGPVRRLSALLLHGMKGPLHVNGKQYEFNAQMPGLLNNPDISDQDLSNLIVYLSNAFGDSPRRPNEELLQELRAIRPGNQPYTEEELLKISN